MEQMNYTLTLSLKHIALVKIASILWNQDDIGALVEKFCFSSFSGDRRQKWRKIEDKVIEKVTQLPQPEPFNKEVLGFLRPIGEQILIWMEFHLKTLSEVYVKKNFRTLCWTPQGTVDLKKTAEALIKDENLDNALRYKLACIYCLEDGVRELWNSMPKRRKADFYNECCDVGILWKSMSERRKKLWTYEGYPSLSINHELVMIWTFDIQGEIDKVNGLIKKSEGKEMSYQFAFEYSAYGGNKAATEYFLQKLTHREREESLLKYAGYVAQRRCECFNDYYDFPKEHYTEVLCFLLSQLNEVQQAEVFEKNLYAVLKCFLDWPRQSFFMETANFWIFLSREKFMNLLESIVHYDQDGYKDYDYRALFEEFWQKSSKNHKEYIIDEYASGTLFPRLFQGKDKKNLSLILRDATLAQKEKVIFDSRNMDTCRELVYNNEWDLLMFFINECVPSQEKIIKFKNEMKKRLIRYLTCFSAFKEKYEEEKDTLRRFFQLMNNLITKYDKKRGSMQEDNSSPAKRLCNSTSDQF